MQKYFQLSVNLAEGDTGRHLVKGLLIHKTSSCKCGALKTLNFKLKNIWKLSGIGKIC